MLWFATMPHYNIFSSLCFRWEQRRLFYLLVLLYGLLFMVSKFNGGTSLPQGLQHWSRWMVRQTNIRYPFWPYLRNLILFCLVCAFYIWIFCSLLRLELYFPSMHIFDNRSSSMAVLWLLPRDEISIKILPFWREKGTYNKHRIWK